MSLWFIHFYNKILTLYFKNQRWLCCPAIGFVGEHTKHVNKNLKWLFLEYSRNRLNICRLTIMDNLTPMEIKVSFAGKLFKCTIISVHLYINILCIKIVKLSWGNCSIYQFFLWQFAWDPFYFKLPHANFKCSHFLQCKAFTMLKWK